MSSLPPSLLLSSHQRSRSTNLEMAPIKDVLTISSRAVVCQDSELKGAITIGSGTVVHPKATIFAVAGPIVIGSNCIIEEGAVIVNRRKEIMRIGDLNLFSIQSRVESPVVGNFNTFLPKSQTASTVRISNCCVVGAGCALLPAFSTEEEELLEGKRKDEVLEPYTVLYLTSDGEGEEGRTVNRRTWDGKGEEGERDLRMKHVEYLREMLPKVTRMRAV
ncbi:trimeric LpxA-like protein [Mrakia frigida]|uniref:dynactin subunit 6 n=1 Tax=Mrakia frigida TaxID=29902 RepID=UPI003FCBF828